MLIECGRCAVGRQVCDGCFVSAVIDTPDGIGDLTPGELGAIEVFELAGFDVQLLQTPPATVTPVRAMPRRRRVA